MTDEEFIDFAVNELVKIDVINKKGAELTAPFKKRRKFGIKPKSVFMKKGLLKEEQPIVEATSGNTGISFAALGS